MLTVSPTCVRRNWPIALRKLTNNQVVVVHTVECYIAEVIGNITCYIYIDSYMQDKIGWCNIR